MSGCIPLLFPRLLCQTLEHLGYPPDPQLERKRICREVFTLDKWTNMTAYRAEHLELPHHNSEDDTTEIPPPESICRRSMPHIADIDRDSEQPCSGDVSYSCSPGADFDHPDSAHCHPEAASAPSGSSISY
ncbi:hypothetical protein AAG906_018953 [Vitis piasezkii]